MWDSAKRVEAYFPLEKKEKKHSLHAGQQLKSNIVASFERFSIFTHKKHPNILKANLTLNIHMHLKKTHQLHYLHKLYTNCPGMLRMFEPPTLAPGPQTGPRIHREGTSCLSSPWIYFRWIHRRMGGDRYSSLLWWFLGSWCIIWKCPSAKIWSSNWIISPNMGEHKKHLKPPSR